ncbi:hypothetical protein PI125_g14637 [Phytophthora idaei]|nr:hypothetical protein PI125_g14637 [Phytophthora idaei]
MANPTNRTERRWTKESCRKLEMVHEPMTSIPSLKSDPVEASIVRGDPRDDAPEPEAAYGSDKMKDKSEPDEMEYACEPGETEDPTRNLDEQFSIVSDRSAVEGPRRSARIVANSSDINIVHDLDDDDDYNVMESDAKNDDGASDDNDSDSEGELDINTDNDQGEEGEEEADGPLFDSSLIDVVGALRFAHN